MVIVVVVIVAVVVEVVILAVVVVVVAQGLIMTSVLEMHCLCRAGPQIMHLLACFMTLRSLAVLVCKCVRCYVTPLLLEPWSPELTCLMVFIHHQL